MDNLRRRPQLLAAGHTDAELQRLRRTGAVVVVRRGAYVPAVDPRLNDPAATHELLVQATVPSLADDSVVSHVSGG